MFDLDSCIGFLTNVEAKKLSEAVVKKEISKP